jgi:hypothetical protein
MVFPLERTFQYLPRVGERLDIGDVFGPCATVTCVTHFSGPGFYYPGKNMRESGVDCKWNVNCHFRTLIDVLLDSDFYEPHTFKTWHEVAGWDRLSWLVKCDGVRLRR